MNTFTPFGSVAVRTAASKGIMSCAFGCGSGCCAIAPVAAKATTATKATNAPGRKNLCCMGFTLTNYDALTAFHLPHPVVLLGGAVAVAAVLTWVLPAGQYDRRDDPATGRRVVVAGTYHPVERAPVGPFGAALAIPRGVIAAADVVGVVLFVGGAWVVVDRLGTLP